MHKTITTLCILFTYILAAASFAQNQPTPTIKPGDRVYHLDPASPAIQSQKLPSFATWVPQGPAGETCFKVTVPASDGKKMNAVIFPIDIKPFRGMVLSLSCQMKAQDVTQPAARYNGIKNMIHITSASGGENWLNTGNMYGTFDWKTITCQVPVADDAEKAELVLGLQDSSGTAWIANVELIALRVKPTRPAPMQNPPPAYRGHDLPRLRGVMSPNQFREKDFEDLAKWNVNAIRWQMGRSWGKGATDRDLAEYDRWLDGKLDDTAKALDAAAKYGIKVMIDLHSPPGGREDDRTLTLVLDKKYQDHFVKVWQKIATRFKGHPALWAYDLVNEPVQNRNSPAGLADWCGAQVLAAKAIRQIDPTTAISIEVDGWDAPSQFTWMTPVDVPNVIYQVHMYWPGEFTHQGVYNNWGEQGGSKGLAYPGKMASGSYVDKEALRRELAPVREFQKAYNVHIVVGEFSAIRWAPGADRYLADVTSIFEEYGWDWTYHAFREWGGWSVESADLPMDRSNHPAATQPTDRAKVLWSWYAKNKRTPGN